MFSACCRQFFWLFIGDIRARLYYFGILLFLLISVEANFGGRKYLIAHETVHHVVWFILVPRLNGFLIIKEILVPLMFSIFEKNFCLCFNIFFSFSIERLKNSVTLDEITFFCILSKENLNGYCFSIPLISLPIFLCWIIKVHWSFVFMYKKCFMKLKNVIR